MSKEHVTFRNDRGQRLVGVLHGLPDRRAVISCHGMLSSKQGGKHLLLATELEQLGISVLRFDFAGRGESEGDLFDLSYSNQMADLQAAIDFLEGRGARRLGLFGSSMGGSVALLVAARNESVRAVATLAAVAHPELVAERHMDFWRDWQTQGYVSTAVGRIGRGYYDDALAHDVVAATRVLRAKVLVLHGDCDCVVPVSDAHDIAAAARNVTLEVVHGADHAFSQATHRRAAMRAVASFLAAALDDEAPPEP